MNFPPTPEPPVTPADAADTMPFGLLTRCRWSTRHDRHRLPTTVGGEQIGHVDVSILKEPATEPGDLNAPRVVVAVGSDSPIDPASATSAAVE